jgi:hypothetical protein
MTAEYGNDSCSVIIITDVMMMMVVVVTVLNKGCTATPTRLHGSMQRGSNSPSLFQHSNFHCFSIHLNTSEEPRY